MKTLVTMISLFACGVIVYRSVYPPEPARRLAPDGVYFLRSTCTVATGTGPVTWSAGQEVYEDLHARASDAATIVVSDGKSSAEVLRVMLTQDVADAGQLRHDESERVAAEARAEDQKRRALAAEEARRRMLAPRPPPRPTPTPYLSPLEEPAKPAHVTGNRYY